MSTLKCSNLQNASAASPAITLASDGSATANLSSLNGGPIAGTRNRVINGDMRIDQRNAGASVSNPSNGFAVDRFPFDRGVSSATLTVQRSTTAPAGYSNSLLVTVGTGAAVNAGDYSMLRHVIEGFNVADLAWGTVSAQTVTLSFWVRCSLTGTFGVSFTNNAENRRYIASYTVNSANTWEQKTITVAGDTSGTWTTDNTKGLSLYWDMGAGSTYSALPGSWGAGTSIYGITGGVKLLANSGATFYITGVQLEPGTVATPFERISYSQSLAMCQRYFQLLQHSYGTANGTNSIGRCTWPLKVTMRANMTLAAIGTPTWFYGGGTATYSSVGTNYSIPEMAQADVNITGGPSTLGLCHSSASGGSSYLTASAEL